MLAARHVQRGTSQKVTATICILGSVFAFSCSSNFQALSKGVQNSSNSPSGQNGGLTGQPPTTDKFEAWNKLEVDGNINGPRFNKTQVIGLDKPNRELILRLPMLPNADIDGLALNLPIPSIHGASLGVEASPDGGSSLVLRIPLEAVLRGVKLSNPARLPNGDALPMIPSGELPMTAVDILKDKKIKASVYLAPSVVGLYINTPFDPYLSMTLPIRNAARSVDWGYFTTIPAKEGVADGGFFIAVSLPSSVARAIDDIL